MEGERSKGVWTVRAVACPPRVLHALNAAVTGCGGCELSVAEAWGDEGNGPVPDIVLWHGAGGMDAMAVAAGGAIEALFVYAAAREDGGELAEAVERGAGDAVSEDQLISGAAAWLRKAMVQHGQRRCQRRLIQDLRTTAAQLKSRSDRIEHEMSRLEAMAWTDPLTGLANRRQLVQRVPQLFAEAVRYGKDLACLMIDLDRFKPVNDRLGHAKGDELLCAAARLISSGLRTSDIAVRYGGDEFVVLMPQTAAKVAGQVAHRISEAFARASCALAPGEDCGMSVGISCLRTSGPIDGDDLIAQADSALLAAKKGGKGRILVWSADGRHAETP